MRLDGPTISYISLIPSSVVIRPDEDVCINHSTIKIFSTHPAHCKFITACFLFILLSPDLSFFMEAKLGLTVLGILIPRDLAS